MKKRGYLPGVLLGLGLSMAQAGVLTMDGPEGLLAGELLAVEGAENIAVILPGSGPIDRDGNGIEVGISSSTYRLLAEALAGQGIASLRIDKRGYFGSSAAIADPNDVTVADYAQDARRWVTLAQANAPCVWLAGHSEGGLVALVAAQDPPEGLCGVILLSAGGRPLGQIMLEQLRANPANARLIPHMEAILTDMEEGRIRPLDDMPTVLHGLFSPDLQTYMIDLFSYDPVDLAQSWGGPALIVQGAADLQINPEDAVLLDRALTQSRMYLIKDMTHMLKAHVPGKPLATYLDPSLPLHARMGQIIGDFIAAYQP